MFCGYNEDDTAFTLNTKCYDAAIRSFAELVEDLSCGQVLGMKQNLDQRTFSRCIRDRLRAVSSTGTSERWISMLLLGHWTLDPIPIHSVSRNSRSGRTFSSSGKIDVLDSVSEIAPGTITAIDHDSLTVSTVDRDVALRKVLTIDGQPLPIPDLVAQV